MAVGCNIDCQTTKFNSPPKFPAIWYVCTINFDIVSSMLESYAGLRKKMEKLAKEKDCELIGEWRKSVINHLYWSAVSTPSGDGEEIKAKWLSLDNHIHNKHRGHGKVFPKCQHGRLPGRRRKKWFKPREFINLLL